MEMSLDNGGNTVGKVADALPYIGELKDVMNCFLPGWYGGSVEYQSIPWRRFCQNWAGSTRCYTRAVGAEAAKTLINEPDVKSVIDYLKNTNILIYGMGIAEDMAVKESNLRPNGYNKKKKLWQRLLITSST